MCARVEPQDARDTQHRIRDTCGTDMDGSKHAAQSSSKRASVEQSLYDNSTAHPASALSLFRKVCTAQHHQRTAVLRSVSAVLDTHERGEGASRWPRAAKLLVKVRGGARRCRRASAELCWRWAQRRCVETPSQRLTFCTRETGVARGCGPNGERTRGRSGGS
eukprot:2780446-Rhodomonas_salina.2